MGGFGPGGGKGIWALESREEGDRNKANIR